MIPPEIVNSEMDQRTTLITINSSLKNSFNSKNPSLLDKIIAASIGGIISSIVVNPLDVIKSRLQTQYMLKNIISTDQNIKFYGTWDALYKIVKYEGLKTLWRGLPPSILITVPASVLYFTSYETAKETLEKTKMFGFFTIPIIAGFGARILTATVTSPLEMIRTYLQATPINHSYNGLTITIKEIINKGGFRSLWIGLLPTLIRDAPFSAIYWFGYEYFKLTLNKKFQKYQEMDTTKTKFLIDFFSGASAGMIAAIFTTPIDVIKTRRQAIILHQQEKSIKIFDIIKILIKEEGFKGFTKGLFPRVVRVAPACAIMISSYEWSKKHLNLHG